MPSKSKKTRPPVSSMHESKHKEVATLLEEDDLVFRFNPEDGSVCERDYDTNIMGRFVCRNPKCTTGGWASQKVAITIRMYANNRYNARVYNQRCKTCDWICAAILDASYAERVAYRLKKWSGRRLSPPPYSERAGLPHRRDLCEGCRAGHCSDSRSSEDWL